MGAGTPARPHRAADRKGAHGGRDVVTLGVAPRAREDRDLRCSAQPEAASQGTATPAFLSRDGQGSRRSRASSARYPLCRAARWPGADHGGSPLASALGWGVG